MNTLVIAALAALAGYVVVSCIWPLAPCRRCAGTGKRRSPSGRYWRPCGRCDGSGRRVRLGRVLFELGRRADD